MKDKPKVANGHVREELGDSFAINESNLEGAAHEQLRLMAKYVELSAEAQYEVARLDERKKHKRSELILETEKNPKVIKGSKNAASVEAYYRTHPEYIAITKKLVEAMYRAELMKGVMFLLSQRRDMLDMFSRRQIALNNISTPSDDVKQRVSNRIKKRLNKKGKD